MDRTEAEARLIEAVRNLFEITNSAAFSIPIPNTSPPVYLACGEPEKIKLLLP